MATQAGKLKNDETEAAERTIEISSFFASSWANIPQLARLSARSARRDAPGDLADAA